MALGSLSLPSVSTGFSSDSKSMMPVSIQGMADKVEMSLNVNSMEDILIDVRDAIHNTSLATLKSFTMLQETMMTGFTMLSDGLMNIGNIAAKDLGLEETQTKIDIDNKKDDDKNESLNTPSDNEDKGPGILSTLKGAFDGIIDKLTPKSFGAKFAMIAGFAALLMLNFDEIAKGLGKAVEFIKTKILPGFKLFFKNIQENIGPMFTNILATFGELFVGLGNVFEGILTLFTVEGAGKFLTGIKQLLFDLPIRLVSVIGDVVFTLIESFAKAMGIDAPWISDIKIAFRTLPDAIDKVITDTMKFFTDGFDKLTARFTEDGLVGALLEGFRMFYDNTIGFGLNLLYDITGAILKLLNLEKLGEFFQNADFTFDGIKRGVKAIFVGIEKLFNFALDGVKGFINGFLPPKLQIPLSDGVKTPELIADEADQKKSATGKYQSLDEGFNEMFNDNVPADNTQANSINGVVGQNTTTNATVQKFNETYTDKIVKESSIMKEKQIELNKLETVKNNDTAPGNITVVTDAKKISGDTVVANNTTVTNHRVDSIESSSNALLQYFRT